MRRAEKIRVKNILGPSTQQFAPRAIEQFFVARPDIQEGSFGVQLENDLIDGVNQRFETRCFMLAGFFVVRCDGSRRRCEIFFFARIVFGSLFLSSGRAAVFSWPGCGATRSA
jgi:hypothetical protein